MVNLLYKGDKRMKKIIYVVLILLISGCAAGVHQVVLDTAMPGKKNINIMVVDGRLDKRLYMNAITLTSASHIYTLSVNPTIEVVLKHTMEANEDILDKSDFIKAEVIIEEIDIKNKVGFAKADELYCKIESKLKVTKADGQISEYTVKTFSVNKENRSPFITTAAKVILDQCMQQHGTDLVEKLKTEN